MNAQTNIKPPDSIYSVLAERMARDGVFRVRYYVGGCFSVKLADGREGVGRGVEAAIAKAKAEQVAA